MAFRAASLTKHARTFTTRLSSAQKFSPTPRRLRFFSSTPIHHISSYSNDPPPPPLNSLVADAIKADNDTWPKRVTIRHPNGDISDDFDYTVLPPRGRWGEVFPWSMETKSRFALMDAEVAKLLAEAYVPEGSKDRIVVEAFPGPGVLTRALLDLPKDRIKKLIVLEDYDRYYNYLQPLQAMDPRVTVLPVSGYMWTTYEFIEQMGLLKDVKTVDWSEEHPNLTFIGQIPYKVHGEQLVSQLFRSIPDQTWFFKYGRVPMHMILSECGILQRISAPPGNNVVRCKLSVIAQATASLEQSIPPEELTPYEEVFHPIHRRDSTSLDFLSVTITPLQEQLIQKGLMDDWDYCLRRLFVQKAQPIKNSIVQLAPGAGSLLKKITSEDLPPRQRISPKTPVRKLTVKEWKLLVETFADWPFKPDDLSIDSFHVSATRQESKKVI
ncbi:Dimethyladenosine transferase 1, mitochondrial [Leucoagaricus sp. SymC.cos]|nr:Dimethyladenosine transferase 1, mitochondrial [Leucoagaricus sp. SymC.cos]